MLTIRKEATYGNVANQVADLARKTFAPWRTYTFVVEGTMIVASAPYGRAALFLQPRIEGYLDGAVDYAN